MMMVATAIVASARLREESRGAHWRDDFEGRREEWHGHLIAEQSAQLGLQHHFVPAQSMTAEPVPIDGQANRS